MLEPPRTVPAEVEPGRPHGRPVHHRPDPWQADVPGPGETKDRAEERQQVEAGIGQEIPTSKARSRGSPFAARGARVSARDRCLRPGRERAARSAIPSIARSWREVGTHQRARSDDVIRRAASARSPRR
jgi:hypothetical protein